MTTSGKFRSKRSKSATIAPSASVRYACLFGHLSTYLVPSQHVIELAATFRAPRLSYRRNWR
jgi:hypothetical protein